MKRNNALAKVMITVAGILIAYTTGCVGTNNNETEITQADTLENEQTNVTKENISDTVTVSDENMLENQESLEESIECLYSFNFKVFFNDEPVFNNPTSELTVDLGFDYNEGQYTKTEEDDVIMYYDEQTNLLATVVKDKYDYCVEVYNADASFNIKADTGMDNECLELLKADIEMNGTTASFSYNECCYRSYTGVWFFGIGKIQNGEIYEYDTSWMQVNW